MSTIGDLITTAGENYDKTGNKLLSYRSSTFHKNNTATYNALIDYMVILNNSQIMKLTIEQISTISRKRKIPIIYDNRTKQITLLSNKVLDAKSIINYHKLIAIMIGNISNTNNTNMWTNYLDLGMIPILTVPLYCKTEKYNIMIKVLEKCGFGLEYETASFEDKLFHGTPNDVWIMRKELAEYQNVPMEQACPYLFWKKEFEN